MVSPTGATAMPATLGSRRRRLLYRPSQLLFGDERPRDDDAVELQGHRPLRAAVGHRHVGLVAKCRAVRSGAAPSACRSPATARRTSASSRDRQSRPNVSILDFRVDKALQVRALRQAHGDGRRLQRAELGRGDQLPHDDGRDVQGGHRVFSTRASCGSGFATTSSASPGRSPRAGRSAVRPFPSRSLPDSTPSPSRPPVPLPLQLGACQPAPPAAYHSNRPARQQRRSSLGRGVRVCFVHGVVCCWLWRIHEADQVGCGTASA